MRGRIVCAVNGSDRDRRRTIEQAESLAVTLSARLMLARLGGPGGESTERLLARVSSERADLLLVRAPAQAPLGLGWGSRMLRELSRRAPCPVVALPLGAGAPFRGSARPESIVCGVDASLSGQIAARAAGRLAAHLGLRLIAVHACDPCSEDDLRRRRRLLSHALDELGGDAEGRLVFGHPARMLAAVSTREQGRLVVVGSRGLGALRSAVSRSVSISLASAAQRPVVIVPPASRACV